MCVQEREREVKEDREWVREREEERKDREEIRNVT